MDRAGGGRRPRSLPALGRGGNHAAVNVLQSMRSNGGPCHAVAAFRSPEPMRHLLACLFALTVASGVARAQEDELLPVEQAFALDAKITEAGQVALHWEIAPDYYMYRSRIKAKSTQAGVTLGALALPAGEQKHDEFLGDVEVYHHAVDASLP